MRPVCFFVTIINGPMEIHLKIQRNSRATYLCLPLAQIYVLDDYTKKWKAEGVTVVLLPISLPALKDAINGIFKEGLELAYDRTLRPNHAGELREMVQLASHEAPRADGPPSVAARALTSASAWASAASSASTRAEMVAVCGSDGSLTFAQLHSLALAGAHSIAQIAGSNRAPVGVMVRKSCLQLVAVLSVASSGRAYVPIKVDQPFARVQQILGAIEAQVVLRAVDPSMHPPPGQLGSTVALELELSRRAQLTTPLASAAGRERRRTPRLRGASA